MPPTDRPPTMEEFVREVIVAMRAAGLEGDVTHDRENARLVHKERGVFDLASAHQQLSAAPAERRTELLATAARLWVRPPELPESWEAASQVLLPHLRTQMSVVTEDLRRRAAGTAQDVPRAQIPPHLSFELAIQVPGGTLTIPLSLLTKWGVDPEAAFRQAGRNLAQRSAAQWLGSPEAPGVYASPWRDGLDASRVFLPPVFARVPLRGRPVVLAPTTTQLLLAGSDDPDGLFHLAHVARRSVEKNRAFHFLRALRMGEDGESWEDWLPPRSHPAYDPLRFLRGLQEVHEYEQQIVLVRDLTPPGERTPDLPRLNLVQSDPGGESVTMTVWQSGDVVALPRADLVVLRRGEETLGFARWDELLAAIPELQRTTGYPPRHVAGEFPEDWQLGPLDLKPWHGPLP